ncbi:MAG: multiheme c-type cytochrome [Planctomycetaceae bacterium]
MKQLELATETREAWGKRSLRWTLALTVFLTATGLVILLAPFGTGAQVTVLAHTLGGILFLAPLGAYLGPHLARRWRDRFSHLVLLGWTTGAVLLAVLVSGLFLTVQALWGRRIGYAWDLVHTIAGCALPAILGAHLATTVRRNRRGEWRYVGSLIARVSALGLLFAAFVFGGGEGLLAPAGRRVKLPENYGLRYGDNPFRPSLARTDWLFRLDTDRRWVAFLEELAAEPEHATPEAIAGFLGAAERAHAADSESMRRGESHPEELDGHSLDGGRIAALRAVSEEPSPAVQRELLEGLLARARADLERNRAAFEESGGIAPEALSGSRTCGTTGCHEQILEEWEPSAHRYASRSAFFQLIQGAMAEANGAESTRYCAGCHDPIALFSGSKNIYNEDLSSPGADEGVSCISCHAIVRSDVDGNANYTLSPPQRYLGEEGFLGRFLIRAYPRYHKASLARPLLKTPEFCGACHKQFIDKDLNRSTRVQLQNQYDAWKGSHWFVPDPRNPGRHDETKALACRDCHMRQVESPDPAVAANGGRHRHHGFIAANQWLPLLHGLPHAERHVRLTDEWLRGETVIPEIADRWPAGPIVPLAIEAPEAVRPGETVRLRVLADNRKVGHTFPTGPLDVIQAWIEVVVTRGEEVVFRSGGLDEQGFLDPASFLFKAEGVDRAGNLIDRHNLWDMVGSRFRRMLFPGHSDREEYTFVCESPPAALEDARAEFEAPASGELVVTATLRYRKVDQTLLNMFDPSGKSRAPVTDMTTVVRRIRIAEAP